MSSLLNISGKRLLLNMGMSQRDFAKARLLPFLEEEGFLVANSKLISWRFSEVIQLEDALQDITIAGPGFQGVSLHQLLNQCRQDASQGSSATAAPSLTAELMAQVLGAMELVLQQKPDFQFAGPVQILLGRDESGQPSILFLPPTLFRRAVESRPPQEQSQLSGCYINPLLEGEEAAAFSQSVYLYQLLARTLPIQEEGLPFPELDPQRRIDDYRDQNFLPLDLAVPGVNPPLAAAVNRNLRLGSRKTEAAKAATTKKTLNKSPLETAAPLLLAGMLEELGTGTLVEELSQEEKRKITQRREAFCRQQGKRLKRQRLVRRYSTWIKVGAALLVAAALAGAIRLKDWRQEYVAYGLTPSQVCRALYTALEEQNLVMAKAMVSKDGHREAGVKEFLERLSNFFVANRMRTGMDPTSRILTPEHWRQLQQWQKSQDEAGEPLQQGQLWVYGIDNFHLQLDDAPGPMVESSTLQQDAAKEEPPPLLPCYPPQRRDRADIQSAQEETAREGQQLAAVATYDLMYSSGPDTITVESHRDQLTLEFRKGCWQVVAIRQEF